MFLGNISYRRPSRVTRHLRLPKSHPSIPPPELKLARHEYRKSLFHTCGKHLQLTHVFVNVALALISDADSLPAPISDLFHLFSLLLLEAGSSGWIFF